MTTGFSPPLARERLVSALAAEPPRLDLAALAIATLDRPELDAPACLHMLDVLACRVQVEAERLHDKGEALAPLRALRHVLSDIEGFRGNEDNYHSPENSFLDQVLERKLGLPITLSVVYLEVARRAGIPLYGVPFPGHFLVAHDAGDHKLVMDPFHQGDILTEHGCEELLKRVAPQLKFDRSMLAPAPVELIAYRMLSNLRRVYLGREDRERGLAVVDLLLLLAPDHPGELRTRAALLANLGAYRAALRDVERCLELSPEAPDRERLELTAQELRERAALLN
ncbi:transglutaminase-like domain-containing protein [Myxococcus sp. MISCRS1]|jgi:regulator of sirC expression with transglutaminase-like and TPR domain|uniref:SirB1 family protein n=1 Tax=Myxococcus TaxID=32 RepID=UPI001CBB6F24|nr:MULTISPECIES: transglutaminase-like domain-containing protein [unclassified Myxococcus]MCY0997285.1 transglutaminase-like domain-containing protein [Myxococcus sp. MISCRS1]BDT32699.1 tetratricopeptide repeat protein [Myxococcus sp. MH1]